MALIEGRDMFSTIRNTARFCLLLPENGAGSAAGVLYLLPVRRGLATDWVRYTCIEQAAREKNLAVIMPEGIGSDFCNMVYGMKWWDFLTEEFPAYLKAVFGIPDSSFCSFGAEMGGEASIRLGLCCPERCKAAGAAGADFLRVSGYAEGKISGDDLVSVYGERPVAEDVLNRADPVRLAGKRKEKTPDLYLHPLDTGADILAEAAGQRVRWLQSGSTGWKKYGECLEEFLENISNPGGSV